MNGILCIDKPEGFTSFDVIRKLRGILKIKRLGHAGTLDPMATGVLPVFAGYATGACGILPDDRKGYTADFQLGEIRDTQDSTGKLLESRDFSHVTGQLLEQALSRFTGNIRQLPPMYSAVSVGGKRLYELAREGKTAQRRPRQVRVDSLKLTRFDEKNGCGTLEIACGTGVYVRTILHDLGQHLGCGAVMTGLRRTMSNGFGLDKCRTLPEIQKLSDENRLEEALIPIAEVFAPLVQLHLDPVQTVHYRNGVKLGLSQFREQLTGASRYAVYGEPDGFLGTAVTDMENNCLRVERNLCAPRSVR